MTVTQKRVPPEVTSLVEENRELAKRLAELEERERQLAAKVTELRINCERQRVSAEELRLRAEQSERRLQLIQERLGALTVETSRRQPVEGPTAKTPAAQDVSRIQKLLSDKDSAIRENAASQLGRLGADAAPALAKLLLAAEDEAWHVRQAASEALKGIPGDPVSLLIAEIQCSDLQRRSDALRAMGMLGVTSPQSVEAILPCLDEPAILTDAIEALSRLGDAALPAAPTLCKMLATENEELADLIAQTLVNIGPEVIETVSAYQGRGELAPQHRRRLQAVLDEASETAADASPDASADDGRLQAGERFDGADAANAEMETGFSAPATEAEQESSLPCLVRMLSSPQPAEREAAAISLGRLGQKAAAAVPELERVANCFEPAYRNPIGLVLTWIPPDATASRLLQKAFDVPDLNAVARPAARNALEEIRQSRQTGA